MGDIIFQGGQHISLSDPQYFARGTTYFGPNLKYMVEGGTLSGGTKYSVTGVASARPHSLAIRYSLKIRCISNHLRCINDLWHLILSKPIGHLLQPRYIIYFLCFYE